MLLALCWKAAPAGAAPPQLLSLSSSLLLDGWCARCATKARGYAATGASAAEAQRASSSPALRIGEAWSGERYETLHPLAERAAECNPVSSAEKSPQQLLKAFAKSQALRARATTAGHQQSASAAQPSPPPHPSQMQVLSSERQAAAQTGFMTGVTTVPSGQGFKKTFYKRQLPTPPSTPFASAAGRQLFAEAMAGGHMNGFFKLMEQFSTQDDPAFCGLASLAMVLNALAIDPRRTWKGAWRWFHEQMLDCCRPLDDVKREGITLTQAACLARCNGARVALHSSGSFTLEELRRQVQEACASGEHHLVVSYTRRAFQQTGDGHFSPVGGYHATKDLVLILDVARFKYPPHWVPLPMLYEAMKAVDPVTGLPRGFLHISSQPLLSSVLLTLDVRSSCWQQASQWVRAQAPELVRHAARAERGPPPEDLLARLLAALPMASLDAFLMLRHNVVAQALPSPGGGGGSALQGLPAGGGVPQEAGQGPGEQAGGPLHGGGDSSDRCMPVAARQQLLMELRALPLFSMVQALLLRSGQLAACTRLHCEHADVSHTHHAVDEVLDDDAPRLRAPAAGAAPANGSGPPHVTDAKPLPPHAAGATASARVSVAAQPADNKCGSHAGGAAAHMCCQPPPDHIQLQAPGGGTAAEAVAGLGNSGYLAEKATMLLLLRGQEEPAATPWLDMEAGKAWSSLMDTAGMNIVEAELAFLREQWAHIDEVVQSGTVEPSCGSGCSAKLDCAALKCSSSGSL